MQIFSANRVMPAQRMQFGLMVLCSVTVAALAVPIPPVPEPPFYVVAESVNPPTDAEIAAYGQDAHAFCCIWASQGQCDSNARFMRTVCQRSCGTINCTDETYTKCTVKVNTSACAKITSLEQLADLKLNLPF